jgi:very-short-patch-repair endonuclease
MRRKLIPYKPYLKELARKLRTDSTLGEVLLWKELNNKQIYGHDFHRQKPLLNYIVDFYCNELDLVIEIDGQYHNDEEQYKLDLARETDLEAYNLTILRLTEHEVKKHMKNVLRVIEQHILEHTPNPSQEGN